MNAGFHRAGGCREVAAGPRCQEIPVTHRAQANTGALLRYVNMGAPIPRPFSTWQLVSPTPRRCEMNPAKNEAFSFIQGPGEPSFTAHVDKPGERSALFLAGDTKYCLIQDFLCEQQTEKIPIANKGTEKLGLILFFPQSRFISTLPSRGRTVQT